ncbi:MAG TPA: DUF4386 domain-containing protein [Pyrinomonadaceae bacterium]|nr:DUF4386 domain-containing protein [Pyrinomonadaceae bacterium]
MKPVKSLGRLLGMLLVVQIAGLIVPFVLLRPMMSDAFLANAAGSSFQIKVAVFLLFANCALTVAISIATFPLFREYSRALALLPVAVSVIMFTLQAVDNAHLMSMLSLSQEYVRAGGPDELFQTLAVAVRSPRRWVHYSELLAIDAWICVLYSLLYRFRLVPRALAAFGLITVLLHFTGITLPLFLEYRSVTLMGVPMAVSHLALAIWLISKGFAERHNALRAEAQEVAPYVR